MLQRTIICITGVFIAFGFAEAQAGGPDLKCDLTIDINALRGGSPTVTVNGTKNVTAKARILKGTAVKGTTLNATLLVEALHESTLVNQHSSSPHRLVIGKGGTGDTFPMQIPECNSGLIDFVATFFGPGPNGVVCEASRTIRKTCN